jgi:hypothetical protein
MKDWLHSVRTLVWKDLLQEWRSKDMLTAMFAFAILTLFILTTLLSSRQSIGLKFPQVSSGL